MTKHATKAGPSNSAWRAHVEASSAGSGRTLHLVRESHRACGTKSLACMFECH